MDEVERRLRQAMREAMEEPPAGLMDAIRRRHQRHLRRVVLGCAGLTATVALAVPAVVHGLHHDPLRPGGSQGSQIVTPSPSPSPAPGTALLTCDSQNSGQLQANWRSGSLKVGPLWFVDGRTFGYVHRAVSTNPRFVGTGTSGGKLRNGVMILEVANGSTVVMKPAPDPRSHFRFVEGYNGPNPNRLPHEDTGLTLVSCPRGTHGDNGNVADYYLGFQMKAGTSATVNIWTSPRARPIRVIFTCPGPGCEG
jgi:hypothetical protein